MDELWWMPHVALRFLSIGPLPAKYVIDLKWSKQSHKTMERKEMIWFESLLHTLNHKIQEYLLPIPSAYAIFANIDHKQKEPFIIFDHGICLDWGPFKTKTVKKTCCFLGRQGATSSSQLWIDVMLIVGGSQFFCFAVVDCEDEIRNKMFSDLSNYQCSQKNRPWNIQSEYFSAMKLAKLFYI